MRIAWHSALFLIVLASGGWAANRISITAQLDTTTHDISGWVTVTWPALDAQIEDMHFRVYANLKTGDRELASTDGGIDSTYTVVDTIVMGDSLLSERLTTEETDLRFPTDRVYLSGDSLTVRLHFVTHVAASSRPLARLFVSNQDYLLDGWFPMPSPRRNGSWEVIHYAELSELVADFFDFEVTFTAPDFLRVIGAGLVSADSSAGLVAHTFSLPSAHDFALYLSPALVSKSFAHGPVSINIHTPQKAMYAANEIAEVCGKALDTMGAWVALYPFSELNIVLCELGFFGGIELPRMIVSSAPSGSRFLGTKDVVMIHEVVHQWFYGIINSNQASTPWMDETVTDYFTERMSRALYGEQNFLDWWGMTLDYAGLQRLQGIPYFDRMPITWTAERYFSTGAYIGTVYNKGAGTLRTLFSYLKPGDELAFWHRYYEIFRFATPTENDFVCLLSEYEPYVGTDIVLRILHNSESIDYSIERIANEPVTEVSDSADSTAAAHAGRSEYKSTVAYAMYNPIGLPVTLRVCFADGSCRDTVLSPISGLGEITIVGDQPLVSAYIDPDGRVGLDKDVLNNSLTLSTNGSAFRLCSGVTFLVETLISYVWGM